AGQVTGGAVADPPGRQPDVGRLGAAELAARTLDVSAVLFGGRAHVPGIPESPAERLQARAPLLEEAPEPYRRLEDDGTERREVRVLQESNQLIVAQVLAVEVNCPAPPVGNCSVGRAGA